MDRNPAVLFVEHSHQLEAGAQGFEVLAQRGHTNVLGALQAGDRTLADLETAGELPGGPATSA